jgi:Protein of unknown function (DUF3124)
VGIKGGTVPKVLVLALSFLILASCVSQDVKHQAASQAASGGVEPDVSSDADQVAGQTIYVPIYSHIYTQDKSRTINLAATLSIRNTDAQNPIRLACARYYGSNGELLREYVPKPLRLAPMASTDFVVEQNDTSGGVGANFIVDWSAATDVTAPVVEAVMISTASQQGLSFVSTGRVLKDRSAAAGIK